MEPLNGLSSLKIALLIDFDNVLLGIDDPGFDVELVVNALRERGQIVMGRCYGDWYRHNRHRRKLMEQGLELVETPAFGPVIKNSADIRIALDGFEIAMTQHHIDTFCLVSGDSDFLPLIKKLQYLGKTVLVICGNRFTSDMLRRNCNEFISYENLLAQSVGATEDATTLDGAFALLHRAMEALRERGAEIRSSTVKQMMLQLNPTFSERNFGCPQFRGFLDKAVAQNLIKLGGRDKISGEFSVLLPEEDEIKTDFDLKTDAKTETKPEIRFPAIKSARTPREPRAPRQTTRSIEIVNPEVPTETLPLEMTGEGMPDHFSPAEQNETDDHSTTASALLSRGLRRGRLRFSGKTGKTGRPEKVEAGTGYIAEGEATDQDILAPAANEDAPENVTQNVMRITPDSLEMPTATQLQELAQQVAQTAAQISVGTAPPLENETSPAVIEALQAQEAAAADVEAPKKATRRRRRKSSSAEKSDADTMGLSIPGPAFEIVTSPAVPEATETANGMALGEKRPTETPNGTPPAIPEATETSDATPSGEKMPTETATGTPVGEEMPTEMAFDEAATLTEATKKPTRRRRTRKKPTDEASPESPGE